VLPELGVTHMLLLQGPAGPFMHRFGEELRDGGVHVTKVNFHAGDDFFYPDPDAVSFREPFGRWPRFVEDLMEARGIDGVCVFGDCRPLHRVAIEVADTGAGIPAEDQERVFDFAYTTRDGGSGLGLAMVHQVVVEEHGGQVKLDSRVGEGTAITLSLPAAGAQADA